LYIKSVFSLQSTDKAWRKQILKHIIILISQFILLALCSNNALADGEKLLAEKTQIIQYLIHKDGRRTEDIHKEYWKNMPPFTSNQQQLMNDRIQLAFKYQRESWKCILTSMELGRVYKSPKLYALINKFKSSYAKNTASIQAKLESLDTLLDAAINQKPIHRQGNSIYITKDLAEHTINGLDAGIERIEILLNKDWPPVFKERNIGGRAKVLWQLPFSKKVEDISIDNKPKKLFTYSSNIGTDTVVSISQIQSAQNDTNRCIQGMSQRLGLKTPLMFKKQYQGFGSSEAMLVIKEQGVSLHVALKCIDTKESLFSIFVASENLTDTVLHFDMLLDRLIFIKQ
jgi:hypothetical protein